MENEDLSVRLWRLAKDASYAGELAQKNPENREYKELYEDILKEFRELGEYVDNNRDDF